MNSILRTVTIIAAMVGLSACAENPYSASVGGIYAGGRHGPAIAGGALNINGGGEYSSAPQMRGGPRRELTPEERFLRSMPRHTIDGQDWLPRHAVLTDDADWCPNGVEPDFDKSKQIDAKTIRVRLRCVR